MAVTLQSQHKTVPYVCAKSHFQHETGYSFMTFGLATNFHLRELSTAGLPVRASRFRGVLLRTSRRVERQLDIGFGHRGNQLQLVARVIHQQVAHAARWHVRCGGR